jgi:hypothetical protein
MSSRNINRADGHAALRHAHRWVVAGRRVHLVEASDFQWRHGHGAPLRSIARRLIFVADWHRSVHPRTALGFQAARHTDTLIDLCNGIEHARDATEDGECDSNACEADKSRQILGELPPSLHIDLRRDVFDVLVMQEEPGRS